MSMLGNILHGLWIVVKMVVYGFLFIVWWVGCSIELVEKDPNATPTPAAAAPAAQQQERAAAPDTAAAAPAATPTPAAPPSPTVPPMYLKGYVSPAFDITVDGRAYPDSEVFFTEQLASLQQQAHDAGYTGYTMKFDAQLGLKDLKNQLHVFVVSTLDRGFAFETDVGQDGSFSVKFPEPVTGTYRIRAVKRIGVVLTPGLTTKDHPVVRWCWNFSAVERDINVEDPAPVILNDFETAVTKYQCDDNRGLKL